MTLYLLDANVLIRAHADYYPLDRIPQFWAWLLEQAEAGVIKMPRPIYLEVAGSSDLLGSWLCQPEVKTAIILSEPIDRGRVQQVLDHGYGPNLDDVDLEKIGQDPFLVAAALGGTDRMVVTRENSKPSAQKGNRKIPDVCATFGIIAINDFALYRELDFKIT